MSEATLHINLNSVCKNMRRLQNISDQSVETAAVLKADAYGLGINAIAPVLFNEGVRKFFVATVDEAINAIKQFK